MHDASGQMLEVGPNNAGLPRFEMEYDAQGMQTRFISRLAGAEADYRYLYGPGDRRLVTFDTTTGERVFKLRGQGDEVLREYNVNGWGSAGGGNQGEGWQHVKDFLYGPEGIFATRQRNGDTMYLHKDHLGTPVTSAIPMVWRITCWGGRICIRSCVLRRRMWLWTLPT